MTMANIGKDAPDTERPTMESEIDGAGAEAQEATGHVPIPPVRDHVIRSEKKNPAESTERPSKSTYRRAVS
jgi:hypothetical protein